MLFKLRRLCIAVPLVLNSACAFTPAFLPWNEVTEAQLAYRNDGGPVVAWSEMDNTLKCLGDRMREARLQPFVISHNLTDTTAKTGVDQGLLGTDALQKIAGRGNGMLVSSYGIGPTAPGRVGSPEHQRRTLDPASLGQQRKPDWVFEGGVVEVNGTFLADQTRYGPAARDISIGVSGSVVVTVVTLSYSLKDFQTGINFPGATITTTVSYQQAGNSVDAAGFVAGRIHGKERGIGLHFGKTRSATQSAADVIRLGMEFAAATLLAERFSIDMSTCPRHVPTPDAEIPRQVIPTSNTSYTSASIQDLPNLYKSMDVPARLRWVQSALAELGYSPGPIDGIPGLRTAQAIASYQRDRRETPDGVISLTLFARLAQDRRASIPGSSTVQAVRILLNQPVAPYRLGSEVRATVSVPVAGGLWCYLFTPTSAATLFPILAGRPNQVSAAALVLLPDNNTRGAHPVLLAATPGAHALYCALARGDISTRLPEALRGGERRNQPVTIESVRRVVRAAAGSDWIGEGEVHFNVLPNT